MKKYTYALIAASLFLPVLTVSAEEKLDGIADLLFSLGVLVKGALPVAMGLALLAFFWGLAKFIFNSDNEEAQDEGKNIMKWGILALFVMVSVWGIISFIGENLGIGQGGDIEFPTVNI